EVRAHPRALAAGSPPHQQARSPRLREEHRPAQGARRPGRCDHLDQPGRADRPSGKPEGRGWGSPRLRLVTRDPTRRTDMSRIGRMPVVVPSGVEVAIDGSLVTVKGPQGTLTHTLVTPITT